MLIPHKIAAYTYHLNNTSTITDAPTIRSLKFILQDEFEDWRDGEMLIQSLIETDEEVDRAAAHQARLEKLMLAAGGIAGPGSIGTQAAQPEEVTACMRKSLPVEDLARDERFVRVAIERALQRPATRVRPRVSGKRDNNRLTPDAPDAPDARPCADARHLRGRDPGPRGRRPHLLGLRRPATATTRRRSSSSSTWPASAGTRPATARSP